MAVQGAVTWSHQPLQENEMPVILWLLGVPLLVVLALMFFNVI